MKRKIVSMLLVVSLVLSGCASSTSDTETTTDNQEEEAQDQEITEETDSGTEEATDDLSELDALGDVDVETELFDVVITIPADYVGESTQEELEESAAEYGYTVTLNDDGTATYVMTKSQHKEMMQDMADNINESLAELVGSEDYPNITDITTNNDFTEYVITTTNESPDLSESFLVMGLYIYTGMYHVFNGTTVDNVHVDYVNADTGEIISSANSEDMEDTAE